MLNKLFLALGLILVVFIGGVWAGQSTSPDPGEIDFYERPANGTNYIGFRAPDSLTATTVYTLTADAPGFFRSDGAGKLSIVPTTISASLVTTKANSNIVIVPGMTANGRCSLTPTNSTAAANISSTYVSAKAANQITVNHARTAGLAYDIFCTP